MSKEQKYMKLIQDRMLDKKSKEKVQPSVTSEVIDVIPPYSSVTPSISVSVSISLSHSLSRFLTHYLFSLPQMDVLLAVCGYSPVENHPTAHTPQQPLSALKLDTLSQEKNTLRRRVGGSGSGSGTNEHEDNGGDENFKSTASQ